MRLKTRSGQGKAPSNDIAGSSRPDKGKGVEKRAKSDKSKNGKTKKRPALLAIDVSTAGQEGGQISPCETTGPLPSPRSVDAAAKSIIEGIDSGFGDTEVRPVGFSNGRSPKYAVNVCYRNSVISMLLNIPTFSNWLNSYVTRQEVLQADPDFSWGNATAPILNLLAQLNRLYWAPATSRKASLDKQARLDEAMASFFQSFVDVEKRFNTNNGANRWEQEDAEDFLVTLLDCIAQELNNQDWLMSTVLQSLLTFGLLPREYCVNGCQLKRQRARAIDRDTIHRLHIGQGLGDGKTHETFLGCLDASYRGSDSPDDPETYCRACKTRTRKRTSQKFVELPKILLTMFSRNTQNKGNRKIETNCPLPPTFIPVVDGNYGVVGKYKIAGVVSHQGTTGKSGHNISYVPNHREPGNWYTINDDRVTPMTFEDINKFVANRKAPRQLPYIIAWELIDANIETAEEKAEATKGNGTQTAGCERQLNEREAALAEREKVLTAKEKAFQERVEREAIEGGKAKKGKAELDDRVEALTKREKELDARDGALQKQIKELDAIRAQIMERERDLDDRVNDAAVREADIAQKEVEMEAKKNVCVHVKSQNDSNETLLRRTETNAITQLIQEVDERKDTATFCATFRNSAKHDDNARAIFKLNAFDPSAPTRIESTVHLSDPEGNLRFIKKGTTVADEFTITFNVKGGKKRKRGDDGDDDKAGPPQSPAKKTKGSAKQAETPDKSAKATETPQGPPIIKQESNGSAKVTEATIVKKEPSTEPQIQKEPQPPKTSKASATGSTPPPRRSSRARKGKRSNIV